MQYKSTLKKQTNSNSGQAENLCEPFIKLLLIIFT